MRHTQFRYSLSRSGLIAALALSAGCVFMPPPPERGEVPAPEPVAEAAPPPAAAITEAPEAAKAPAPPMPDEPVRTAIVISDDIAAYVGVAEALTSRLTADVVTMHNLDGLELNASRVAAEVADADRIVAVGLLAAAVLRRHSDKTMVFCKVFNYQDHDLISPTSKGVSFLPPFDMQVEAWKEIAPQLRRIGIITGAGQEPLVEEIRAATSEHGIMLASRVATSDKEALVEFKRLTPEVQGLWLLPDNRILSPEVVREIMSYSAKHRKQIVVFGRNLLVLGALMSITTDDEDVAAQVVKQLESMTADGRLQGPDMQALTEIHVDVNTEVARYLGLDASERVARTRAVQ